MSLSSRICGWFIPLSTVLILLCMSRNLLVANENKPALYGVNSNTNQSLTIVKGRIVDSKGNPVIGAGIVVKGTTLGTSTDINGYFSFKLPDGNDGKTLIVSSLGYDEIQVPIGSRREFNLVLKESVSLLEGTVVTALGIKRKQKALSYNVQEVKTSSLVVNKDANFVNALNGKVAGLVINSSSSGVGGASKVIMRGQKSIMTTSNALYVIDGVPLYSRPMDAETEFGSLGATDPIADINPEDIESMTVLTGAAAAALYGSEAANGAIVITTKKGQEGQTSLVFSSNTELSFVASLPDFQNTYGTGDLQSAEGSSVFSWGRKLNEINYMGYSPRRDYFQTGVTGTENISFSTGNKRNQTYFSAGAVNNKGIIPNHKYDRYNFSFRNTSKFLKDKMTLDISGNYVIQNDRNVTNQGLYNNPIVGAYLFPRGDDWADISMYERWDSARKIHTQYWPVGDAGITMQNPYWINYRNLRLNEKRRYMASAGLSYEILPWLTASGRVRFDNSNHKHEKKYFATTNTQLTEQSTNGLYGKVDEETRQIYADFLLDVNKTFKENWTLHANVGASISDIRQDLLEISGPIPDGKQVAGINLPNVFNIFSISPQQSKKKQFGWHDQQQSIFGSAELGYKGTYFLTLTGRNDWPSQLAGPYSSSKSFFYPSVGLSTVLSQAIELPRQIEYLKFRASYASVGSPFDRFIANPVHTWNESEGAWSVQTSYPVDLKPERTHSYEVGLTSRFLDGFRLDATWYLTNTNNQTFDPDISKGSGYSSIYIQSGSVRNMGVELLLGYEHTWNDFTWSTNYTFSSNKNKIKSLAENAVNPVTGEKLNISALNMGGLGNVKFILKKGGSLGDIYSRAKLKRDNNNDIYINQNGKIGVEALQKVEDYIKLGSILPKANMSWRNDFKYKNLSLAAMVTARFGGVVYSRTQAMLDYFGVSKFTADARDAGGVVVNGSDLISPETWYQTIGGGDTVPLFYTYSATNIRLQEASIGYTFDRSKLGGVCELTLQLVGRNLFMIYNKAPFDPESVATTTNNFYQGIDYFMLPNTRNFGFNIRMKF